MKFLSWPRLAVIALALLLSACAAIDPFFQTEGKTTDSVKQSVTPVQKESPDAAMLRQTAVLQDRLDRVAAPLLVANPDLCKQHSRNLLGISARNKYSYSANLAESAASAFHLDDRLQITSVLPGSGAEKAGAQRGDILLAVEGKTIPTGERAENEAAAMLATLLANKTAVKLTVHRDKSEQSMTVPLTRACGFRIELGNSDNINSYSDGSRILITRGMMQFAQNDDELAYVIAKEMAHNVLGHAQTLKTASTAAGIIDRLVRGETFADCSDGMKPMPQQYDIAADRLSLYMTARAGRSIDQAPAFWQRLAAQYPASKPDSHTALHPASSARTAAMNEAIPKIKAAEEKRKSGNRTQKS